MADAFEVLLSLGSGTAKRKRENELIQLQQKERQQQRLTREIGTAQNLLIDLLKSGFIEPEVFQMSLGEIRNQIESGQGFQPPELLPERIPSLSEQIRKEAIQQRQEEFETREKRLSEAEARRKEQSEKTSKRLLRIEKRQKLNAQLTGLKQEISDLQRQASPLRRIANMSLEQLVQSGLTSADRKTAKQNLEELKKEIKTRRRQRDVILKELGIAKATETEEAIGRGDEKVNIILDEIIDLMKP